MFGGKTLITITIGIPHIYRRALAIENQSKQEWAMLGEVEDYIREVVKANFTNLCEVHGLIDKPQTVKVRKRRGRA